MADDLAEALLEGVPYVTENYEKVYDPLRDKTKQGIQKVKSMRQGHRDGYDSDDYDRMRDKANQGYQKVKSFRDGHGDDYDSDNWNEHGQRRPHRDNRRRSPRDNYDNRYRRSGRGDVVEERYAHSKSNGRARSVGGGRDDRHRGEIHRSVCSQFMLHYTDSSLGSRRDYSDSESSLSPPRRERRKSLGEKALVALGLEKANSDQKVSRSRDRRRRSRSRGARRRGSTPSSDSDGYYVRKSDRNRASGALAAGAAGGAAAGYGASRYQDDRTPDRYRPANYQQGRDAGGEMDGGGGRGQEVARRDYQGAVGTRNRERNGNGNGDGNGGDSSSESSSDVCSSSEDERRTKKMKGKEFLTAGLAAVATIHAAHSVYSSMEARDKRHLEVAKGEMSPEEARKRRNKMRIQDAAAIGIAALGIKGAYSEWQEVQEHRKEAQEAFEEKKRNHEKRMRKAQKLGDSQYGRSRSEGPRRRDRDRDYSR